MKFLLALTLTFIVQICTAQNYQAIHGSPYAGSLAPLQNPAAIVHVPYPWDLTIFSVQLKHSTNAFRLQGLSYLSLLSPPDSIIIAADNGIKKHFLYANQDLHLFNFRTNIGARTAIAFGGNVRSYLSAESLQKSNFQDTIQTLWDYMRINLNQQPLAAHITGNAWVELFGSIAFNIINNGENLLNVGATLKVLRPIAGIAVNASDLSFSKFSTSSTGDFFTLQNGSLSYSYSSNFDAIDSLKSLAVNRKAFLEKAKNNFSVDVGLEYIMLANEDRDAFGGYAYETKIGLALMDLGSNTFNYGARSRTATGIRAGVTDSLLEIKFTGIENIDDFNDSLVTVTNNIAALKGNFSINRPTRLLLNVDKHLAGNIFINTELTIPLTTHGLNKATVKELNLLALTPRWELKYIGFYIPFQYNNKNQFWVGSALKLGPLLIGTHNVASLISKNKIQKGGFYIAFTLRPRKKNDRENYLKGRKINANESKMVRCPKI